MHARSYRSVPFHESEPCQTTHAVHGLVVAAWRSVYTLRVKRTPHTQSDRPHMSTAPGAHLSQQELRSAPNQDSERESQYETSSQPTIASRGTCVSADEAGFALGHDTCMNSTTGVIACSRRDHHEHSADDAGTFCPPLTSSAHTVVTQDKFVAANRMFHTMHDLHYLMALCHMAGF